MQKLLLSAWLAGCLGTSALAQTSEQSRRWDGYTTQVQPDVSLTQQAFRLGQQFTRPGWRQLAAQLRTQPRPVERYLGFAPDLPLRTSLTYLATVHPLHPTPGQVASWPLYLASAPEMARLYGTGFGLQFAGEPASLHATNQLYRHLWELKLARRQTDYERLSALLLQHATKVHKLEQALPVLLFKVDSTGQVQDVNVDGTRSTYGLTSRSRKLILKALASERFQALEARNFFNKPRPWQERVARVKAQLRLGQRVSKGSHQLFGGVLYKTVHIPGRCGGTWRQVSRFAFWK